MDNSDAQEPSVINVSNSPTLKEVEREYVQLVMSKALGSKSKAAKILGVSVKTVYNLLDSYKEKPTTQE